MRWNVPGPAWQMTVLQCSRWAAFSAVPTGHLTTVRVPDVQQQSLQEQQDAKPHCRVARSSLLQTRYLQECVPVQADRKAGRNAVRSSTRIVALWFMVHTQTAACRCSLHFINLPGEFNWPTGNNEGCLVEGGAGVGNASTFRGYAPSGTRKWSGWSLCEDHDGTVGVLTASKRLPRCHLTFTFHTAAVKRTYIHGILKYALSIARNKIHTKRKWKTTHTLTHNDKD